MARLHQQKLQQKQQQDFPIIKEHIEAMTGRWFYPIKQNISQFWIIFAQVVVEINHI